MLAWLGEWLQGIVVVVLLAIIIELILPSSKMLRYSRLVVGLILLLTILNPVMQIFQVNFQDKLDASFSLWEKEIRNNGRSMPSLQQISDEAELLKQQREEATLDITRISLEQTMLEELKRSTSAAITDVSVRLGYSKGNSKQSLPYIDAVTVTVAEQRDTSSSGSIEAIAPIEIAEVSIPPVNINDGNDSAIQTESDAKTMQREHSGIHEQWSEQLRKHAQEIVNIIASGWNVQGDRIFVQAS